MGDHPKQPTKTQPAILQAALEVFAKKGVAATSIEDIRAASGASTGSIYHHFGSKDGIAAALFRQALTLYWDAVEQEVKKTSSARDAIRALVQTHVVWSGKNAELARFMFSRRAAIKPEFEEGIRAYTKERFGVLLTVFGPYFKNGELRKLKPALYGPLLLGPVHELTRSHLAGRGDLDPKTVIDDLVEAAWRVIRP